LGGPLAFDEVKRQAEAWLAQLAFAVPAEQA
jgi:hypothetical protein